MTTEKKGKETERRRTKEREEEKKLFYFRFQKSGFDSNLRRNVEEEHKNLRRAYDVLKLHFLTADADWVAERLV